MAAPTFVDSQEGATWDRNTTTTRSITITVTTGDRLVLAAATEDNTSVTLTLTNAGGQTWTAITGSPSNVASRCKQYGWTATSVTTGSITVEVTAAAGNFGKGLEVYAFSGSDGFGNVIFANGISDDPSFATLTTLQPNSAVVLLRTDWNASDTPSPTVTTYRTASAGSFTERSYLRNSAAYTVATGYHPDAGAAGAKTLGHTTTGTLSENWIYMGVEVFGSAAASTPPILVMAPPIPA